MVARAEVEDAVRAAGLPEVELGEVLAIVDDIDEASLGRLRASDLKHPLLVVGYLRQKAKGGAGPGPGSQAGHTSTRDEYLRALSELRAPSSEARSVHKFVTKHQALPPGQAALLLNLRPATAASVVPMQLLVPCFQDVITAAWSPPEGLAGVEEMDLAFAHHLCMAMSSSFSKEEERQDLLLHMLSHYLGSTYTCTKAGRGEALPDVIVTSSCTSEWLMLVEVKNEIGTSGDALLQGQLYYAKYVADKAVLRATSYCPMLMVEVVGPLLRVTGLAINTRVSCQPLTPCWNLLDLSRLHKQQVTVLAHTLAAVRTVLRQLAQQYAALPGPPTCTSGGPEGPPATAAIKPALGLSPIPMPLHLQQLVIQRQASHVSMLDSRKMVYLVRDRLGSANVVKYTQGYGEATHRAWAAAGLAPKLHSYEPLAGGWVAVEMEHLSLGDGWVPLTALLQKLPAVPRLGSGAAAPSMPAVLKRLGVPLTGERLQSLRNSVLDAIGRAHSLPVPGPPPAAVEGGAESSSSSPGGGPGRRCSSGGGSEQLAAAAAATAGAAHGDLRDCNVMVQLAGAASGDAANARMAAPHPGSSSSSSAEPPSSRCHQQEVLPAAGAGHDGGPAALLPILRVAFVDFDWAGREGAARYPLFLNPALPWPDGAAPGALIRQHHDQQLLLASMLGERGKKVWPWESNPVFGLGYSLAVLDVNREEGSGISE